MLKTFYPFGFQRYASLVIFGPIVDGFSTWLLEQRYNHSYAQHRICLLRYLEAILLRRGIRHVSEIGKADWSACQKSLLRRFPNQSGITCALERYLHVQGILMPTEPVVAGATARYLVAYTHYLETVCGASASTIQQKSQTASEFLAYVKIDKHPGRLKTLTFKDLEAFIKLVSGRFTRASLRSIVTRLRCFLRFLAVQDEVPQGLDHQLDTPRVYREENLPSTLPWETVQTLLGSIDQSRLVGLRDFTMFSLMAVYGLRASDVVALTLDNIHWRVGKISISQRKTGTVLELPLTDAVGTILHRYLKKLAPSSPFRQLFLSLRAPIGPLQSAAVSQAFRRWAESSGVDLPGRGSCHRIRHSYAVFLLRKNTPIKAISDILGHRTLESTSTYLRLAIEDLRDVALPVPTEPKHRKAVRA
jgi:integrase/recombinase XerD